MAQAPKFPFVSAKKGLVAATAQVESVQSVTGELGTVGEQGVPVAVAVHQVIVAPGIGATKPCTVRCATLSYLEPCPNAEPGLANSKNSQNSFPAVRINNPSFGGDECRACRISPAGGSWSSFPCWPETRRITRWQLFWDAFRLFLGL